MMNKVKVGVVGYGTIGQRLADGVVRMGDCLLYTSPSPRDN